MSEELESRIEAIENAIDELACIGGQFTVHHQPAEREAHDRLEKIRVEFGPDHVADHRAKRQKAEAERMTAEEAARKAADDARAKEEAQSGEIKALKELVAKLLAAQTKPTP